MFNLSLIACSFYFQKLHSRNVNNIFDLNQGIEYENEDSGKIETIQIKDLFINFFKECEMTNNDEDEQKTFRCEFENSFAGETNDFYYVYAIVKSGIYGSASDIIDKDTGKVTYNKKANEADEKSFYLYIAMPKDSNDVKVQKGLLFFQNIGSFGVKTISTDLMRKFFSNNYGLAFKCRTVSSDLFIKKIITKENVKNLIMVKNHISDDSADNVRPGYGVETRIIGKLFYKDTAWDKIMNSIRFCARGKHNLFEFESKKI